MESGPGGWTYLRVSGGCMEPRVPAGWLVGADPARPPRHGDLVVARRGAQLLVKELREMGDLRWLVALAAGYAPILLAPPVELIGVVALIAQDL